MDLYASLMSYKRNLIGITLFVVLILGCSAKGNAILEDDYNVVNYEKAKKVVVMEYNLPVDENEVFEDYEAAMRIIMLYADNQEISAVRRPFWYIQPDFVKSPWSSINVNGNKAEINIFIGRGKVGDFSGCIFDNRVLNCISNYTGDMNSWNDVAYYFPVESSNLKMEYMVRLPSGKELGPYRVKWYMNDDKS